MMQLGAVGAVKVAVRSLSMGVGPSKSQKPYFSVLSLVYYYLIRCKGNVHDYASNCHQSFECYRFPYSSFVVSTIFYILTVSIQVEVRSSTCVSWVLVHSIYFQSQTSRVATWIFELNTALPFETVVCICAPHENIQKCIYTLPHSQKC